MFALAFSTAGAAQASDINAVPIRSSNGAGEFASGGGFAHAQSVAVTPTGSRVYVGSSEFTGARVAAYIPNPSPGSTTFSADGRLYGAPSGLASSYGVKIDKLGRLWTADQVNKTVSAFAPNAVTGNPENSTPALTISGPNTGLEGPNDVAFAPNGDVIVSDNGSFHKTVRIYAANTGGNISPKAVIDAGVGGPSGVAVDSHGVIYVANAGLDTIQVYAANATTGATTIRTISGASTTLHTPRKLAIDSSDNLYVVNTNLGEFANGSSVAVFAPGAHDDATPVARLVGAATTLQRPSGIALDANRNVYVSDSSDPVTSNLLTKFSPLMPFLKPSTVRNLTVSGSSTSSTRTVRWSSPTNNGGTPITKYRIIVKMGTTTLYDKTTTSRSYKLWRSKLRSGTNKVNVYAYNKVGRSTAVIKSFTVKK